jgi:hypothetical protein
MSSRLTMLQDHPHPCHSSFGQAFTPSRIQNDMHPPRRSSMMESSNWKDGSGVVPENTPLRVCGNSKSRRNQCNRFVSQTKSLVRVGVPQQVKPDLPAPGHAAVLSTPGNQISAPESNFAHAGIAGFAGKTHNAGIGEHIPWPRERVSSCVSILLS